MATKILRVFQEFTSEGYVPMPPTGNIDYGFTIAGTFPSTTPATFQTDNPDLEVEVTEVTDFYVWIRSNGTEWNYQYTRNVRVYPDSPSINNVVMGIIIANLGNTVPYTGATENVDLGEFGIKQGYSQFDLTPTNTPITEGTMSWNDGDGTLDLILKGGNVTLQLGQELVARCYNAEATTLVDGEIVYIYGSQGNRVSVKRASASSEMSSSVTFGMVTESIASGAEGFVTISGVVNKLDTSALTAGTALWLGTTPGTYTPTKPTAPIHSVLIGYVERVHATVGSIYVKVQNGYELDELHNVKITTPTENDFLVYDDTQQVWENRAVIKANGFIPYFDSTDLFKQSPIFVDGVNVTMNGMPLLLSDEGQLNYITKFGSTKTVINSLLYDTGTKVGVGTTNPEFLFTVVGGSMGVYSSSTNYGYIDTANNSMRLVSANGFNFTANNIGTIANTRVDANGNWGFGIGTPSYKVDVNGDVNINGNYRINGSLLSTSNIAEGTNLYFTSNRVLGQVLTGLNTSLTGVVTAADSLIVGISKLQNQVSSIVSGVSSVFGRTGAVVAQSGDYTTAQVTESGNLYYTDARARNAISGGIGISYNNTTGLIAFSGTLYTDATIRALFSAGSGISYNNTTGVITSTITQYTDAMARASLSFVAGSGAYNSTTGVITIPTNTNQLTNGANYITLASLSASNPLSYNNGTGAFSISQASGSTNGFLSSTDWTTFNNKQNALGYTPVPTTRTITINGTTQDLSADRTFTIAGTISGLTTNYVPKATSATTIGNSLIFDNGTNVGISNSSPSYKLDVFHPSAGEIIRGSYTGGTKSPFLAFQANDDSLMFIASGNSDNTSIMGFKVNGTERMRITSSGNVGIGTTSPNRKLQINSGGLWEVLRLDSSGVQSVMEFVDTTGTVISGSSYGDYFVKTNDLYRLYILRATGNVGIGLTNPSYKLDIAGDLNISTGSVFRIGGTAVSLFTGSGTTNYHVKFTGATSLGNSSIFDNGSAIGFYTASPAGVFQVAGSGNIFFGDTPSNTNYKFNVKGFSGNYISFWTPTLSGVNQNGIMSHSGAGLGAVTPLGYYASAHIFGGEVTGGGLVQVAGDVNISGTFRVNGTAIGTGGGGVSGSGTTGYHAKWSSSTSLTNSIINESGDDVGVNGSNFPRFTFRSGATYRGMIGINTDNLFWIASAGSTELILSTNSLGRISIKGDGKILFNSSTGGNLILEATGGGDSALYTTLSGNLRAVARFTQDFTNYRGVGFGYDAGDQLGFIYGTTTGSTASKLGLLVYNGSSWVNMLIAKSNTINLPSLPTSTSGLVFGDLYVDANGFVKRYNVV